MRHVLSSDCTSSVEQRSESDQLSEADKGRARGHAPGSSAVASGQSDSGWAVVGTGNWNSQLALGSDASFYIHRRN